MCIISYVFYFFISLFLVESSEAKFNVSSSLMSLLELQMDHCSSLTLCTIRSPNNAPTEQTACCKNCSCDVGCIEEGTCCPDYHIANLIGFDASNKTSDLADQLRNLNSTIRSRMQKLEEPPLGGALHHGNQDTMDCVVTRAVKVDFNLDATQTPSSYRMVSTCPMVFQFNTDTENKCEDDVPIRPFATNKMAPDLVVPVTSLYTNITYKNIYCFRCNEGSPVEKDLSQWKVIFTCSFQYYVIEFDNPYIFFRRITSSQSIYSCNLVYQPSTNVQQFVKKCSAVDVKTCLDKTDKELNSICETYYMPVLDFSRNRISSKVYQNIACYLCNRRSTFRANCENIVPNSVEFSMELNFLLHDDGTLSSYSSSDPQFLNASFGEDISANCERGFILINETGSCRLVLCPRYFYPVNGSCIPEFSRVTNISFTVMLEVIRLQTLNDTDEDKFYQGYIDALAQIVGRLTGHFTYGLWKLKNDKDILVLSFAKKESTYLSMLNTLSILLTQVAVLKINLQAKYVEAVTVILKSDTNLSFRSGKLYKPFETGKRRNHLSTIYAYRSLSKSLKDIRIRSFHLCYRTELDPESYSRDGRGTFYLNSNRTVLNRDDVQILSDDKILVCLDDLYANLTDVQAVYMFGGKSASARWKYINFKKTLKLAPTTHLPYPNDMYTKSSSFFGWIVNSKELIITVTLVLVIAVICLVKFIKLRKERRARRGIQND